jgi:hypothetical protein
MRSGSRTARMVVVFAALATFARPAAAQSDARPFLDQQMPMVIAPPLPPATLLEGFRAPIGAVVTIGHEMLGDVKGISVGVRELRDSAGDRVRGVVVEVTPEKSAAQVSYIDIDELPMLIHGLDQLLAVTTNPTQFRNFEVHYATKGELEVAGTSSRSRGIVFSVEVGRPAKARRDDVTAGELQQLRILIEAASQKLATMPLDK